MRFPSLKDVGIYYELFGTVFYDTTCFSQHWKTQPVIVLTAEDQQKPGHCLKCAVSFHADSSALHFLEDINREQKGKKKKKSMTQETLQVYFTALCTSFSCAEGSSEDSRSDKKP